MNKQITNPKHPVKTRQARLAAGQARLAAGQARLATGQARLATGQARLAAGQARLAAGQAVPKAPLLFFLLFPSGMPLV